MYLKSYEFDAIIHQNDNMDAAYIIFPYDIRKEFGKGRVKVHATFDGTDYDGSIVNMGLKDEQGNICYIIGVTKAIRKSIGKSFGDDIHVVVTQR
ncbi:MAG: DUF1905 domain-containing protein [Erysipelotrichaceae bacterium]|nr:DUF1905 domain-containing protein [Erysipelotrichaceae bacterium]